MNTLKRLAFSMLFTLTVVWAPEPAAAGLFRCTMTDGKVVYTDRKDACPGAEAHEIDAEIQTYRPTQAAPAKRSSRAGSAQGTRGMGPKQGAWREKKTGAEQELGVLEEKWDYLNQYITHCNRNRKIIGVKESGLRYNVSCKNIREEYSQVKVRMNEVRRYLSEELPEACRRAGCLPGWIR